MNIQPVDPGSAAARALIAMSDDYLASLYPAESNHLESTEGLRQPDVYFVGCFNDASLVGCGAVKVQADGSSYGEIKRVFVMPGHRGKGVSKEIMSCLERYLISRGIRLARLETGIRQAEALGLYRGLGYVERGPFGAYRDDPLSVFMEKVLLD